MKKKSFFDILNHIENICLVALFAVMVATIFLQIIMRFVFNNSLVWSEELGKFIFVWISWLGISIGERKNEHIKITLITDKLSDKWKKIIEVIAYTVLLGILAVTFFYAVELVEFQLLVKYAGIRISTSWGYLSLVLGCGFMGLRVIAVIVRDIMQLLKKEYSASSHPAMTDQLEAVLESYNQEEVNK
ncbi:MAG: TRAP transporter small permease [Eubacterium sp.]|nr:TRAP transporter small permease [Eubacterium sp.]